MNEVQQEELKVLKEIIRITEKHNLRYFAVGGTCIGAIRHSGFIPWDDDIDIGMPRKDYELFRRICKSDLKFPFKMQDYNEIKSDDYLFTKIYNSQTSFIEEYSKNDPERYTGAFVDIMPVDGFPEKVDEQKKALTKWNRLLKWNSYVRPSNTTDKKKRIVKEILEKICGFDRFSKLLRKYLEQFDFDSSRFVIFSWRSLSEVPINRIVYNKEFFSEVIDTRFEDITIKVPVNYDAYLKQDFGNYMELPPENKRNSGHTVFISDMKTPCLVYVEKKRKGLI